MKTESALTEVEFEEQLTELLVDRFGVSRGDAQGIVEANEVFWLDEWMTGATPEQVANQL